VTALVASTSCFTLTLEDAKYAASSKATMEALLTGVARRARPGSGSPKVLIAVARLAEADWFYGNLSVELTGDAKKTTIGIFAEHGFGIRERIVQAVEFPVSLDEFERAVRLAPGLARPLRLHTRGGILVLSIAPPSPDAAASSIRIDESCLIDATPPKRPMPDTPKPRPSASTGLTTSAPDGPSTEQKSGVHTRTTVRRMVVIRPEAMRSAKGE
jgi:hypothetical protein